MSAPRLFLRTTSSSLGRYSRTVIVMPLRARVLVDAGVSRREYSSFDIKEHLKTQPTDDPDDVLFNQLFGLRTIELNRPNKLNSLNASMARKIITRLQEWEKSDLANVIVIKGAGRAFCAGGDVAALAEWNQQGPEGRQKSCDYFALEYNLDHLIASYNKPYVAYIDGITMGGGVGLSVHAPFRIATENTVFAMPETTIGFFPEVGASFFLPRMDGQLGTYLALTSEQLKGVDVFYHGIATHYLHSSSLDALSERLSELRFNDGDDIQSRYRTIDSTIAEFDTGLPASRPTIHGTKRTIIDQCFSGNAPLEVLRQLASARDGQDANVQTWIDKTIATIRERSPIGVGVTLREMREGKGWNVAQAFQNEHAIASVFMSHPDFVEGVTARLVTRSKERPHWKPNTLEDVTDAQVAEFFANCTSRTGAIATGGLKLLKSGKDASYASYPHAWIALPSEVEIIDRLNAMGKDKLSARDMIRRYVDEYRGKVGLKEKIEEVLQRQSAK